MTKHQELMRLLTAIRKGTGLNQRHFADKLGVPHTYPSRWEHGYVVPDRWHTTKYAEIGDIDVGELVALRDAAAKEREAAKKAAKENAAMAEEEAAELPQRTSDTPRRGPASR